MEQHIDLGNGITKCKIGDKFMLTLNQNDILLDNCSIISYLDGKFIAVKIDDMVQVFKPIARYNAIRDKFYLIPIAEMSCSLEFPVFLKIKDGEQNYIVDKNAQISFCCCYPNVF